MVGRLAQIINLTQEVQAVHSMPMRSPSQLLATFAKNSALTPASYFHLAFTTRGTRINLPSWDEEALSRASFATVLRENVLAKLVDTTQLKDSVSIEEGSATALGVDGDSYKFEFHCLGRSSPQRLGRGLNYVSAYSSPKLNSTLSDSTRRYVEVIGQRLMHSHLRPYARPVLAERPIGRRPPQNMLGWCISAITSEMSDAPPIAIAVNSRGKNGSDSYFGHLVPTYSSS